MTPEHAIAAFWLACIEDGDMDGVALKAAMLKFAAPIEQQERKPMTVEQFTKIAHRTASNYTHRSDPKFTAYTFLPYTLADFVRKVEAFHGIKDNKP